MSDEGGFPYWDGLISWHCDLICFPHTHVYRHIHIHLYKENVTGCKFIIFPNTTQHSTAIWAVWVIILIKPGSVS